MELKRKNVQLGFDIDVHQLNSAAQEGKFIIRTIGETEKLLAKEGVTVRRNSAAYTHLLFFQSTAATRQVSQGALLGVETTKVIGKR